MKTHSDFKTDGRRFHHAPFSLTSGRASPAPRAATASAGPWWRPKGRVMNSHAMTRVSWTPRTVCASLTPHLDRTNISTVSGATSRMPTAVESRHQK